MKKDIYQSLSDEKIIIKILQDHQHNLFEILYDRYYQKVFDKCFGLLKNKHLAKDFTEDIFSRVFEKLATFKNLSGFSSWLYSVTYNHCIDYLRAEKKLHYPEWNRKHELPEIMDETGDDFSDINYENLQVILDMIHPEEKALLIMKYHDNLPVREIGRSLRISENAAKMRIKRARTRVFYLYKKKFLQGK